MSLRASRFGLVLTTEADVCDSSRQLLGSLLYFLKESRENKLGPLSWKPGE
jgi:hypothetical protein